MNEFVVRGNQGFIRFELIEVFGFPKDTSHNGGYDAKAIVEIKSGKYYVQGDLWFITGEVVEFYDQLKRCNSELKGEATFWSSEANLKIDIKFNNLGQIIIQGYFKEQSGKDNELQFEMDSDQSFIPSTLEELKEFVSYYGDMKGVRNN